MTVLGLDTNSNLRPVSYTSTQITDRYNELKTKDQPHDPLLHILSESEPGKKPDFANLNLALALSIPPAESFVQTGFGQTGNQACSQSDPAKLLLQLLDQIAGLGQTAQCLRQALSSQDSASDNAVESKGQLTQGDTGVG